METAEWADGAATADANGGEEGAAAALALAAAREEMVRRCLAPALWRAASVTERSWTLQAWHLGGAPSKGERRVEGAGGRGEVERREEESAGVRAGDSGDAPSACGGEACVCEWGVGGSGWVVSHAGGAWDGGRVRSAAKITAASRGGSVSEADSEERGEGQTEHAASNAAVDRTGGGSEGVEPIARGEGGEGGENPSKTAKTSPIHVHWNVF